jgi:hypothetical protein
LLTTIATQFWSLANSDAASVGSRFSFLISAIVEKVFDGRAILVPFNFDPAADPTPPVSKLT